VGRERIELSTVARYRFAVSEPDGTEPDVLTKLDDRPTVWHRLLTRLLALHAAKQTGRSSIAEPRRFD